METVRYYERIGLLPRPPRPQGTFRRYTVEALQRVRFIKRAQWLGFSLEETAVLLALTEDGCCGRSRALGEVKLSLLRRKLDELFAAQSALQALLSQCAEARGPRCPLVDALMDGKNLCVQVGEPPSVTSGSVSASDESSPTFHHGT